LAYQIHFPREILQDNSISNIQKNILIYMYLYADYDYCCMSSPQDIAKDLDLQYQNISKYVKKMPKYVEVIRNPKNKSKVWYNLLIKPTQDFDQFDSQIYKQFKKQPNIIIEYFKFQVTYKLVRILKSQGKIDSMDKFMHAKIAKTSYVEFSAIEEILVSNGLLETEDYHVKFPRDPNYEAQIKTFEKNYKSKRDEKKKLKEKSKIEN